MPNAIEYSIQGGWVFFNDAALTGRKHPVRPVAIAIVLYRLLS